jgi:ABC-2 type transport system permease protein
VNAVMRAELLRLRTIRAPFVFVVAVLAAIATNAIPLGNAPGSSPSEVAADLRGLLQIAALFASISGALSVGAAFQRGEVASTYTAHPRRGTVAAAHAIIYAGAGAVLSAVAAGLAAGIMLPLAAAHGVSSGLSPLRLASMIAATSVCGAAFGVIGALLGMASRNATIAVAIAVGAQFVETFLARVGGFGHTIGPYLPFRLVGSATGAAGPVPAVAAIALVLLYCAGLTALIRRLALYRDLT